jgi:hypothetical protein
MSREVTPFASGSRSATTNSAVLSNVPAGAKGVWLVLDITTATAGTLDCKLQRHDPASGKFVDIPGAAWAQKTTTGTSELVVYPGVAETANVSVSDAITDAWRIVATIVTGPFVFSISGYYI